MSAPDPQLDLVVVRTTDVPAKKLFRCWTTGALMSPWFAPKPWETPVAEIEPRAGGRFKTTMRGPGGEEFTGEGCVLEVVPDRKLVWTSALGPGYRPQPKTDEFAFTAVLTFEEKDGVTTYTARAMHRNADDREKHAAMGFEPGWSAVFDQLVAYARTLD